MHASGSLNSFPAAANTPAAIVDRMSRTMLEIAADPELQKRFMGAGARLTASTPQQTRDFAAAERKRLGEVVRVSGAKAE